MNERISEAPPSSGVESLAPPPRKKWLERAASIGTSAQAAIPGVYAWAVTVAPVAWSPGASWLAKVVAVVGVGALVTAPLLEGDARASTTEAAASAAAPRSLVARAGARRSASLARAWSIWGFVSASAVVWLLAPASVSPTRFDEVRGGLGMVGWALFAFASAGPVLRANPESSARALASHSLKPRSELPGGDGVYVVLGVALALSLQVIGWSVVVPERAVLVRLVTVVCGMAVLGATTSLALARHAPSASRRPRAALRRAFPWLVLLAVFTAAAVLVRMTR